MPRFLVSLAAVVVAIAAGGPFAADAPRFRVLEGATGRPLTDHVRLAATPGEMPSDLLLPGRRVVLGAGRSAHYSGAGVLVRSRGREGDEVELLDDRGRTVRRTVVPEGRDVVAFARSIVTFPAARHETHFGYDLLLIGDAAAVRLQRPERRVVGLRPLESFLVVHSMATEGDPDLQTEVIDAAGRSRWVFGAVGRTLARVVARDDLAVALYPMRPGSLLRVHRRDERRFERTLPSPSLTEAAFVAGTEDVLVWGARGWVLVGLDPDGRLQASGPAPQGRWLSIEGSVVTPVDGSVAMLSRTRVDDFRWRVQAVSLDVASGSMGPTTELFVTPEAPTSARRFGRGGTEVLIFPDRSVEVVRSTDGP